LPAVLDQDLSRLAALGDSHAGRTLPAILAWVALLAFWSAITLRPTLTVAAIAAVAAILAWVAWVALWPWISGRSMLAARARIALWPRLAAFALWPLLASRPRFFRCQRGGRRHTHGFLCLADGLGHKRAI
jgi:hypothetical protein